MIWSNFKVHNLKIGTVMKIFGLAIWVNRILGVFYGEKLFTITPNWYSKNIRSPNQRNKASA